MTNPGNTRVGKTRGRGVVNQRQTPWQKDPIVRKRMQIVHKMWVEGASYEDTLAAVNKWAIKNCDGHVFHRSTITTDRKNILALVDQEDKAARAEHVESLKHLKKRAYGELDKPGMNDLAKPGFMNVIRAAEETAAKIDGSLVHRSESRIEMTSDLQARLLVQVLVKHLGSEDVAIKVLEEVQDAIDVESKRIA